MNTHNYSSQWLQQCYSAKRLIYASLLLAIFSAFPKGLVSGQNAEVARRTVLRIHGPAPAQFDLDVPDNVTLVSYMSNGHRLKAWLCRPSGELQLRPAVLYAHQGFALTHRDVEAVQPFIVAGYVVLLPTWRGENGNPGEFERYCGEVDDARAALGYLRELPGVDPDRVYAAGDTMGGTTVFLLAESSSQLRSAGVCSAFPDIAEAIKKGLSPQRKLFPYDWTDDRENSIRSPGRHLADLRCPITLYNSDSDPLYVRQSLRLPEAAAAVGKILHSRVFPHTDQQTVVPLAISAMIEEWKVKSVAK